MEQRLIDANAAKKSLFSYYSFVNENAIKANYTGETLMSYEVADMIEDCIDNTPTIDQETLPIVQELREVNLKAECRADALMAKILVLEEELKQVAEERDAAVEQLHGKCYACKHNDTPFHSSGQRDEYKSALQNWHEEE